MLFRAERLDGSEIEGFYLFYGGTHYIKSREKFMRFGCGIEIKPETLKIYLFGEWRLVSELETKYKLVEV